MLNKIFKIIIIILFASLLSQKTSAIEYRKEIELSFNWGKELGELGLLVEEHEVDNIIYWGPRFIKVDDQNNIYVTDTYNNRVQKFNEKGEFILVFNLKGGEENIVHESPWIDFDSRGNIYIADYNTNSVHIFNSKGEFLREFGSCKQIGRVVVDKSGNIWIEDIALDNVIGYDQNGKHLIKYDIEDMVKDFDGNILALEGVYKGTGVNKKLVLVKIVKIIGLKKRDERIPLTKICNIQDIQKPFGCSMSLLGTDNKGNLYFEKWSGRGFWPSGRNIIILDRKGNILANIKAEEIFAEFAELETIGHITTLDKNWNIYLGIGFVPEGGFKVIKYKKVENLRK